MTKHLKGCKTKKVPELTFAQARSTSSKWTLGDSDTRLTEALLNQQFDAELLEVAKAAKNLVEVAP